MRMLVAALATVLLVGCGDPDRTPVGDSPAATPAALPARSDKEQILDAILRDVLESDFLRGIRDTYGTPGDRQVALVSNPRRGIPWPEGYVPVLPQGCRACRVTGVRGGREDQPRQL